MYVCTVHTERKRRSTAKLAAVDVSFLDIFFVCWYMLLIHLDIWPTKPVLNMWSIVNIQTHAAAPCVFLHFITALHCLSWSVRRGLLMPVSMTTVTRLSLNKQTCSHYERIHILTRSSQRLWTSAKDERKGKKKRFTPPSFLDLHQNVMGFWVIPQPASRFC